jgi:hypothetical protein
MPQLIAPGDIILLPPGANSAAAVRAAIGFEARLAEHPMHELFALWYRGAPSWKPGAPRGDSFAVLMRIPKARIQAEGWPLIVDPDTRLAEIALSGGGPEASRGV